LANRNQPTCTGGNICVIGPRISPPGRGQGAGIDGRAIFVASDNMAKERQCGSGTDMISFRRPSAILYDAGNVINMSQSVAVRRAEMEYKLKKGHPVRQPFNSFGSGSSKPLPDGVTGGTQDVHNIL
jgi:hypothetical protein